MLPPRVVDIQKADIVVLAIRLGVIFLGAILLLRIADVVVARLEDTIKKQAVGEESAREKRARTIGGVLRGGVRMVVLLVAALMGVRELGLDITPAIAAAGGFGVAAGLGAQSVVRDWISGFFVIHDDQYAVGDTVRAAGVAGSIEKLTLRHTELRDGDGSLHFIPNGEIKIVTNLTKSWAAPLVKIPVSTDEDPERVLKVLNEMTAAFKADETTAALLMDGPKVLGIDDVAAGQFVVLIQARTRPENRYPAMRALRLAAIRRLRAEGIALHPATEPPAEPSATEPANANAAGGAA